MGWMGSSCVDDGCPLFTPWRKGSSSSPRTNQAPSPKQHFSTQALDGRKHSCFLISHLLGLWRGPFISHFTVQILLMWWKLMVAGAASTFITVWLSSWKQWWIPGKVLSSSFCFPSMMINECALCKGHFLSISTHCLESDSFCYSLFFSSIITFFVTFQIAKLIPEPSCISPEDGGSMFPQNIGIHPQVYTVSQLRRPQSYIL